MQYHQPESPAISIFTISLKSVVNTYFPVKLSLKWFITSGNKGWVIWIQCASKPCISYIHQETSTSFIKIEFWWLIWCCFHVYKLQTTVRIRGDNLKQLCASLMGLAETDAELTASKFPSNKGIESYWSELVDSTCSISKLILKIWSCPLCWSTSNSKLSIWKCIISIPSSKLPVGFFEYVWNLNLALYHSQFQLDWYVCVVTSHGDARFSYFWQVSYLKWIKNRWNPKIELDLPYCDMNRMCLYQPTIDNF